MADKVTLPRLFILFGAQNNIHISRIIGRGQLEHLFIQPLPLKAQLLTCGSSPFTGSGNFVVGITPLFRALSGRRWYGIYRTRCTGAISVWCAICWI